MQEVKKGNWWQRKTKEQKTSFVFAVIIFVISLVGFILLMNARAFVSKEICDSFYGEGVANGWIALGKVLAEGSAKWFVSIVFLFMAITLIFIATFVTHLFDSKSRKAKTNYQIRHNYRFNLCDSCGLGCRCLWHYHGCWYYHLNRGLRLSITYPRCHIWFIYRF